MTAIRIHRPDCPGGDLCTLGNRRPTADVARARGWGPGTRIVGDEGYGDEIITITAVGQERVLAVSEHNRGNGEGNWVFWCRCWVEAPS